MVERHHRKTFRTARTDPEGIAESLTLSEPFQGHSHVVSFLRGCAASRRPLASLCNPYRDTKLLAAIPIGIEEEVLTREMDTQKSPVNAEFLTAQDKPNAVKHFCQRNHWDKIV